MAEKVNILIENEILRKGMGLKAKENVKRYVADEIVAKWVALYEEVMNEG